MDRLAKSCAWLFSTSSSLAGDPYRIEGIIAYHSMRIGQARTNIIQFEVGIVGQDLLIRLALSQEAKNQINGNPQATDNRLAAKDILVGGYSV
jgi:hypothetical protein